MLFWAENFGCSGYSCLCFWKYRFNIIHPIPDTNPFLDDPDGFEAVLDKMDELGLWLMYDMRKCVTFSPSCHALSI